MPVITIAREYGSLGDEIGGLVAERLGLRFVDQEVITEVAERLGVPLESVNARDEREGGLVSDLVRTMRRLYPATHVPLQAEQGDEVDEASYLQVIRQVIWEVARSNDAVIAGRGSAFILGRHPGIVHVLVIAPVEVRVERVMAMEGLAQEQAFHRVKYVDDNRARYIRHFYRTDWLDPGHYDLVLNTGQFSQAHAASLICLASGPGDTDAQTSNSP